MKIGSWDVMILYIVETLHLPNASLTSMHYECCGSHFSLLRSSRASVLQPRPSFIHFVSIPFQDLRMCVYRRHQAHPNRPSHCLGQLPLIHVRQACLPPRLDPHTRGAEFRHDRKILVHVQRVNAQLQERVVHLRSWPPYLILLGRREIMRRVDVPNLPFPILHAFHIPCSFGFPELIHRLSGKRCLAGTGCVFLELVDYVPAGRV